ncbi:hypothetical protein [Flavobacterium sp.]|uniref:hypothetical protein n=1 Tax=Flavobacterium sp. TaxID=239 RepID=UPI0031D409F4
MKKLFILLGLIVISCNTENNKEKIILTSGISMNPDQPRFGIEINNEDTLYYCEEVITNKGHYKFYKSKISSETFLSLRKEIQNNFKSKFNEEEIVDATPYELDIKFDNNNAVFSFYLDNLDDAQVQIINKIIKSKDLTLEEIKHHNFPKRLLTEKLPSPPPPPIKK